MTRLPIAALLILTLFSAGRASAQAPAPSPPADALAVARELVLSTNPAERVRSSLPIIVQNLKPAIVQNRPAVEREFNAIMPVMIAEAMARMDEMIDAIAIIYARHLTLEQMREILAFYRSPTGSVMMQKMPAITNESITVGQKFGQSVASDIEKRMIEELRKRGHKI